MTDIRNERKHVSNYGINLTSPNFVSTKRAQQTGQFASEHYLTDIFDMIKAERSEIDIENDLWAPITRLIVNSL